MPTVSVIMPTFNSRKYIQEALDSIYAQTLRDWELVIIQEHGSTDGTPEFLQALTDARIRVLYCTQWVGISAALNMGIDVAKGEFIARMDDDDICLPTRFVDQIVYLRAHPSMGICGSQVEIFGSEDWTWHVESAPAKNKAMMLFYQPAIHPTFMFRRSVLNDAGIRYNPDFTCSEDYEILSRLKEVTEIGNLQKVLLRYRRHAGAATNTGHESISRFKQAQENNFFRIGVQLTSVELDVACVHGEWRKGNKREFENTLQILLSIFRRLCFSNARVNWCGDAVLQEVIEKRWNDHFNLSGLSEVTKFPIREKYQKRFHADMQFYKFVYRDTPRTHPQKMERWEHGPGKCPAVSIVLPTYQAGLQIECCLHSLLTQTLADFELLIINDGDTSLISEIVAMLDDPRIRLICNEERLGLAESLNMGIRTARGKYVARADADDYYPPERLKTQFDFLEARPEISLCTNYQESIDTCGNILHLYRPSIGPEFLKATLLFRCDVCHSSVMLRKEDFIREHLWYDKKYLMEDFELWTRAVKTLKFETIPKVFLRYTIAKVSISRQKGTFSLDHSQAAIIKNSLHDLDIHISDGEEILLYGWDNPFYPPTAPDKIILLEKVRHLLDRIWEANEKKHLYNPIALRRACEERWNMVCPPEANLALHRSSQFATTSQLEPAAVAPSDSFSASTLDSSTFFSKGKHMLKHLLRPILLPVVNRFADKIAQRQQPLLASEIQRLEELIMRFAAKPTSAPAPSDVISPGERLELEQATLAAYAAYKDNTTHPKLQIGADINYLEGWFNTDLIPRPEYNIHHLDLKKAFPFADNSFRYIYCEHNIEHFTVDEAKFMLDECNRVLVSGGIIRIATPDLQKLIAFYQEDTDIHRRYRDSQTKNWLPQMHAAKIRSKALVLNDFFRNWGHQTIYDFESLHSVVALSGFVNIEEKHIGESSEPDLTGIERHGDNIPEEFNELETMVLEAEKV